MKKIIIFLIILFFYSLKGNSQSITLRYDPGDPTIQLFDLCEYNNRFCLAVGINTIQYKLVVLVDTTTAYEASQGLDGAYLSVTSVGSDYAWAAGTGTDIMLDSFANETYPSIFPYDIFSDINDLLFFSLNNGWAAGTLGYICHDVKGKWNLVTDTAIHSNFNICNLFGSSANNIYLAGQDSTSPYKSRLYHYDGKKFIQKLTLPVKTTDACRIPGDTTKYLLTFNGGGSGQKGLYQYNTVNNTLTPLKTDYGYNCVTAFTGGKILLGGNGNSFYYNGSTWNKLSFGYNIRKISSNNNLNKTFALVNSNYIYLISFSSGINENNEKPNISCYPNPASTWVKISLNSLHEQNANLELINTFGQVIQSKNISLLPGYNQYDMELSDVSKGIYFVRINTACGIAMEKIIINR